MVFVTLLENPVQVYFINTSKTASQCALDVAYPKPVQRRTVGEVAGEKTALWQPWASVLTQWANKKVVHQCHIEWRESEGLKWRCRTCDDPLSDQLMGVDQAEKTWPFFSFTITGWLTPTLGGRNWCFTQWWWIFLRNLFLNCALWSSEITVVHSQFSTLMAKS